jgi:ABC-2 type transport system ATP-binding protein
MPNEATAVAALHDVTHHYGDIAALSHVSLALAAGQVTALLGPNGAGKTTVVRLLCGLARPTSGTARLFGADPRDAPARRRLGVMLQSARVPEALTVREHIHLFSSYYGSPLALDRVLALADLADVADRRYGRLSGGQQRRVQFALALCGDPALLFLDEPTVGMDVESRRGFWAGVRSLAEAGRAILLTTHYHEEADALAHRIVVLNRGRVIADASPDRIKQQAAGRQVRCRTRLPQVRLAALPGVQRVVDEPPHRVLLTGDSDRTLRALLAADESACDIDIRIAGLEDAFLALTAADKEAAHVA